MRPNKRIASCLAFTKLDYLMKKSKLISIVLIFSVNIYGYAQTPVAILKKALKYWMVARNDSAMVLYRQVISDYSANKPALLEAYYKLGDFHYSRKRYKKALSFFDKMIRLRLTVIEKKAPVMRMIMTNPSNPYQQYMHLAYEYLGTISQEQKRYQQAIAYYKISEKKYPSYDQNTGMTRLFTAENYALCYAGLHQPDSVLYTLMPFMFTTEEYAPEALESLKKNLKNIIAPARLKKELKQALTTVSIKEQVVKEQYVYKLYIQLLGKSLFLYQRLHKNPLLPFEQKKEAEKCRKELEFIFKELMRGT